MLAGLAGSNELEATARSSAPPGPGAVLWPHHRPGGLHACLPCRACSCHRVTPTCSSAAPATPSDAVPPWKKYADMLGTFTAIECGVWSSRGTPLAQDDMSLRPLPLPVDSRVQVQGSGVSHNSKCFGAESYAPAAAARAGRQLRAGSGFRIVPHPRYFWRRM